jgi:HPr kinase/phosphorylase
MSSKPSIPEVTVGHFYTQHAESLQLKLLAGASGLNRVIKQGAVNRPGLALTSFYVDFAHDRVQIIGRAETAYLKSLGEELSRVRLRELFRHNIPCLIFARSIVPPKVVLEEAEAENIPVFSSQMTTYRLVNAATICLEMDFAPTTSEHGSMVDIQGIGILVRGKSGIGKSECVLSLIERGHSIVADDITRFKLIEGRELMGTASDLTRFHMEVRGLGIINLASIFGVRSIRLEKTLDLVCTLKDWDEVENIERVGMENEHYEILGIKVPHVTIPVRPGRDLASLVEVAAMDQKLKRMGQNSAVEFNQRLIQSMAKPIR